MNAPMTKAEIIATGNAIALTSLLRVEFEMNKCNIPVSLKNCKGWLAWKVTEINSATGKFSKIPFYPRSRQKRHGQQGRPTDMEDLGTWDDAWMAFKADKSIAGVGFALLPLFDIVALDVDGCIENGVLRNDVESLTAGTYCEISPSGKGIRAFWQGTAHDGKNHEKRFELFHSIGFVTVTGNQVENLYSLCSMEDIQPLDSKLKAELEHFSRSSK